MPQFDFANVFIPQLFWLSVFFLILYFGVVKTTLPRLGKVMERREGTIEGDLAEAKAAKDKADALAEENRATLERNRDEARALVAAAKDDAAKANEKRVKAAEKRLDTKLAKAEAEIDAARAEARQSLRDIATDSAQAIVAKLTGSEPARAKTAKQVDAAMAR